MKRYIQKGTCVKAIQWKGSNYEEILDFVNSEISSYAGVSKGLTEYYFRYKYYHTLTDDTLILTRYVNDYPTPYEEITNIYPRDYVVKSDNGSIKIWKPDLFEDQYQDINLAGGITIETVPAVKWEGDNLSEIEHFIDDSEVEVEIMKMTRWLAVCSRDEGFVLKIGDYLSKDKHGYLTKVNQKEEGE